jgi:hypothetical protein
MSWVLVPHTGCAEDPRHARQHDGIYAPWVAMGRMVRFHKGADKGAGTNTKAKAMSEGAG